MNNQPKVLEFGIKNADAQYRKSVGAVIYNKQTGKVLALDWHIYSVYGISQVKQNLEKNESFELKWVDIEEFIEMVKNHQPTESQNFLGLLEFLQRANVLI